MANNSLSKLLAKYKEQADLLPALKEVQEIYGYLPEELLPEIASGLGLSVSEVYGVGTFYSFLSRRPLGTYVIRVCKSVPCWLKNYEVIVQTLERELGIKPGETTADGRFSLELTNCVGGCDQAPAMMINDVAYGDITAERIPEILNGYR